MNLNVNYSFRPLEIFFNTVDIFKVINNDSLSGANLLTDSTLPGRVVSSE